MIDGMVGVEGGQAHFDRVKMLGKGTGLLLLLLLGESIKTRESKHFTLGFLFGCLVGGREGGDTASQPVAPVYLFSLPLLFVPLSLTGRGETYLCIWLGIHSYPSCFAFLEGRETGWDLFFFLFGCNACIIISSLGRGSKQGRQDNVTSGQVGFFIRRLLLLLRRPWNLWAAASRRARGQSSAFFYQVLFSLTLCVVVSSWVE